MPSNLLTFSRIARALAALSFEARVYYRGKWYTDKRSAAYAISEDYKDIKRISLTRKRLRINKVIAAEINEPDDLPNIIFSWEVR